MDLLLRPVRSLGPIVSRERWIDDCGSPRAPTSRMLAATVAADAVTNHAVVFPDAEVNKPNIIEHICSAFGLSAKDFAARGYEFKLAVTASDTGADKPYGVIDLPPEYLRQAKAALLADSTALSGLNHLKTAIDERRNRKMKKRKRHKKAAKMTLAAGLVTLPLASQFPAMYAVGAYLTVLTGVVQILADGFGSLAEGHAPKQSTAIVPDLLSAGKLSHEIEKATQTARLPLAKLFARAFADEGMKPVAVESVRTYRLPRLFSFRNLSSKGSSETDMKMKAQTLATKNQSFVLVASCDTPLAEQPVLDPGKGHPENVSYLTDFSLELSVFRQGHKSPRCRSTPRRCLFARLCSPHALLLRPQT